MLQQTFTFKTVGKFYGQMKMTLKKMVNVTSSMHCMNYSEESAQKCTSQKSAKITKNNFSVMQGCIIMRW